MPAASRAGRAALTDLRREQVDAAARAAARQDPDALARADRAGRGDDLERDCRRQ